MRLTRNDHHRKLRVPIRDNSDWLVNADVSDFAAPLSCLGSEDSSTPSYLHDYRCLPAPSHEYLLPPKYYLLPSTTTCRLPRLPVAKRPQHYTPLASCYGTRETAVHFSVCRCITASKRYNHPRDA